MSRATFQAGLAAGIVSGMRFPMVVERKKPPVTYLYNGVRMPPLPEWDKTKYPYAYMWKNQNEQIDSFGLYLSTKQATAHAKESTFDDDLLRFPDGKEIIAYHTSMPLGYIPTKWDFGPYSISFLGFALENLVWANHDVLYEDGTLFLPTSEPVPDNTKVEQPKPPSGITYFLYNGVKLPDINEVWTNKEIYPYAIIIKSETSYPRFSIATREWYSWYGDDLTSWGSGKTYTLLNGAWLLSATSGASPSVANTLWTSADVKRLGSSEVVLAASEPVPVCK